MAMGIQDMSNMQRNFLHSSYLLHPNRYTMDHMMEDYNLNHLYTGKVILSGYPRNAIFWDKDAAAAVRKQYGMDGKETFAYMPTWRGAMSSGANKGGYEAEVRDLLTKFDSALTDKQIMYVNLHPLVKDKVPIEGYKHIVKFPDDVDSYSFLDVYKRQPMSSANDLNSPAHALMSDVQLLQCTIATVSYTHLSTHS